MTREELLIAAEAAEVYQPCYGNMWEDDKGHL